MPYLDALPRSGALWRPLLQKELRDLWQGNAVWAALAITMPLTGYSYIQAASLYAEASRSAFKVPELARGLSPLDGIVAPTLGALYLAATFLLPFIAIRTIGAEKQQGTLKLLVQLPYSTAVLIAAKLFAVAVAWVILLLPALVALGFWQAAGGHLSGAEVVNVILGHALYACVVAGFALAAAAITRSPANAAIVVLALTLGCWVLDFAAAGEDGLLKSLSGLSLTSVLRTFERGIFSLSALLGSSLIGLAGAAIGGAWLHPGRTLLGKMGLSTAIVAVSAALLAGITQLHMFHDFTEDRRNSFGTADEAALRALRGDLTVTVYLAPTDPRLYDLERSVLGKLRRAMRHMHVVYAHGEANHGLAANGDDRYGQVVYYYREPRGGRRTARVNLPGFSRSTSEEEILPLIFSLAHTQRPPPQAPVLYPGYPLVAASQGAALAFYWLMPAAVLVLWALSRGALLVLRSCWVQLFPQRKENTDETDHRPNV